MESLEAMFEYESALVFGVGGGGDIVGSIPTARLLERHGIDVVLGGVAWEPVPRDTQAGPRSFEEIEHIDRVSETVALASHETRTRDGIEFTETSVAGFYETQTALIDITPGISAVRRGLDEAADQLDIDLIVGVDAGGDVLAAGTEPGIRSPVADGIVLVALADLETDGCLGVFGYGSDGELTLGELQARYEVLAGNDGVLGAWGLTPRVRRELERLLPNVETEASRVPVEAAAGDLGERSIRGGEVSVRLTPTSPITFYFEPTTVAAESDIAACVRGTDDMDDAEKTLREMGLQTEFETERRRLDRL